VRCRKFFANYRTGELSIVIVSKVHKMCDDLLRLLSRSLTEKNHMKPGLSGCKVLDMYANARSFNDREYVGSHKFKLLATDSNEQEDHVTILLDSCIWAGFSEYLRLFQRRKDFPIAIAEYSYCD
jgi:hypothetical protein